MEIANDNCPGQIVISGQAEAVQEASERLKEAGARKCIPLKVSGPFHSGLLAGAGKRLGEELEGIPVKNPSLPYVSNVEADYVVSGARVKELLVRQVSSTVRWRESMERMLADGVDTLIEICPGRTLSC